MMKIREKVNKSNTYNGFTGNILFFIHITSTYFYPLVRFTKIYHIYIYIYRYMK